jgi:hypothetical protein
MGVSGQRHAPAALYSRGKDQCTHWTEVGWAPKLVWTQRPQEKSFASVRDETLVVSSVVRHYTDWANKSLVTSFKLLVKLLEKICEQIFAACFRCEWKRDTKFVSEVLFLNTAGISLSWATAKARRGLLKMWTSENTLKPDILQPIIRNNTSKSAVLLWHFWS